MERDLHSFINAAFVIEPVIHTAHAVGVELDTLGYQSLEYVIIVGDALDGAFVALLEQSPDDGAGSPTGVWTAVPAADILGVLPVMDIADTDKVYRVGCIGKERHQRLTLSETAANTAGILGALAVLGNPKNVPVADQST